eukprot:NODE_38_length_30618_cov_0.377142.p19 type:complete len:148 gc:universal NODE_38_length_30618_cov_0.377142:29146-28703(-)
MIISMDSEHMHMDGTNMSSESNSSSEAMSMGAMGTSFNFKTSGFAILVDTWTIDSAAAFAAVLLALFVTSFSIDLLGRYQFRKLGKKQDRYVNALKTTIRSFIGILLMLAMMTFNFYVILFIVLGTGVAHALQPVEHQDKEAYLCHQ